MAYSVFALSGGLDSATVLGWTLKMYQRNLKHVYPMLAVGFQYGSKHNYYENAAAKKIADHYGVPFHLIDLTSAFSLITSDLLKSGGDLPEGHYEHESMKKTVVPARNMIFTSILTGIAASGPPMKENPLFRGEVNLGIHAGDHAIYPDCRPDFYDSIRRTAALATNANGWSSKKSSRPAAGVDIGAPFLIADKIQILKTALEFNVPIQLTRTCYADHPVACGRCGSCRERLAAFKALGEVDPINYQFRDPNPERKND